MARNRIKIVDSDVKQCEIERKSTVSYVGRIPIFILNHGNEKNIADEIERELKDGAVIIKRDISEFDSYYNDIVDVFSEVQYMVVLISKEFLEDWSLTGILLDNYDMRDTLHSRIIPLIVDNNLYKPTEKAKIIKSLKDYIIEYTDEYIVKDYNSSISKEVARMQGALEMVKNFLDFSLKRDKKSTRTASQKIIKYIKTDAEFDIMNGGHTVDTNGGLKNGGQGQIVNHIYADNVQVQQGNSNAVQTQAVGQTSFDYEAIRNFIKEIETYDTHLDSIYGENANEVRNIIAQVSDLAEQEKGSKKITKVLTVLKDLSIGVTGSLIATGIAAMISSLNL